MSDSPRHSIESEQALLGCYEKGATPEKVTPVHMMGGVRFTEN